MKAELPPSVTKRSPYSVSDDLGVEYADGSANPNLYKSSETDGNRLMRAIKDAPDESASRDMHNAAFQAASALDMVNVEGGVDNSSTPEESPLDELRQTLSAVDSESLAAIPMSVYLGGFAALIAILLIGIFVGPQAAVGVFVGLTGAGWLYVIEFVYEPDSASPLAARLLAGLFIVIAIDLMLDLGILALAQ